jgi:hypothetical protein
VDGDMAGDKDIMGHGIVIKECEGSFMVASYV